MGIAAPSLRDWPPPAEPRNAARPDLPRSGRYTSICELCVRATEGLTGEEVDEIVDTSSLTQMLGALGVELETKPPTERRSPRHPKIALRVIP